MLPPKVSGDKVKGDGHPMNGPNRRAGLRSRCYKCDSEYHFAPGRPRRDAPRNELGLGPQERGEACKPYCSAISIETPVSVPEAEQRECEEARSVHGQPFWPTLGEGD